MTPPFEYLTSIHRSSATVSSVLRAIERVTDGHCAVTIVPQFLFADPRSIKSAPPNASIVFEYGDFECPFCADAEPTLKALRRTLADTLLFAFRHFPLAEVHPYAMHATEAAEAAGAQEKFWQMHDYLFQHQAASRTATWSKARHFSRRLRSAIRIFSGPPEHTAENAGAGDLRLMRANWHESMRHSTRISQLLPVL
jgi:hypothetical protein